MHWCIGATGGSFPALDGRGGYTSPSARLSSLESAPDNIIRSLVWSMRSLAQQDTCHMPVFVRTHTHKYSSSTPYSPNGHFYYCQILE